jgi:hypothetical protein
MSMMRRPVSLALLGLLLAAACGGGEESNSPPEARVPTCQEADVYERGLQKPGDNRRVNVAIVDAEPAPPQPEVYNKLRVRVTDGSAQPMYDVTLVIDTLMPEHNHGVTVPIKVTPLGQGEFELNPLYLFMAGLWEITVIVMQGSNELDRVTFSFCI